jgi:hypothetical protein
MRLPVGYLTAYNAAIALACAATIGYAAHAYDRAHIEKRHVPVAAHLAKVTDAKSAADQAAVSKVLALSGALQDLTKRVAAEQTTLAAEIAKTRTMKRKVVTGSTIVSYAG